MKVTEPVVSLSSGHCCVCAGVCYHIGPIRLCKDHKPANQKESQ